MVAAKTKEFKINEGFIFQKIGKGITIFDSEQSLLFTLNETAAFIFKMIKSGEGKEVIIKKLVLRFEVSEEKAGQDIDQLILKFLHEGIVTKTRNK